MNRTFIITFAPFKHQKNYEYNNISPYLSISG